MDLCGPMRVESINRKRYVLVIVDDYSRYTWAHFLRSKDKAPEKIKTFLKKILVLRQALVFIVRNDNSIKIQKSCELLKNTLLVLASPPRSFVNTSTILESCGTKKQMLVEAARNNVDFFSCNTKDHPLEQAIGEPSRPVLTRNQLRSDGDMCMYALTVSIMEPKNVKEAITDPAWIESMQEELLQFKRLD
ncbi:retrovirus-related pol polyprotein from transposon TNT 1-94, partial [Tanacetum coccineum]